MYKLTKNNKLIILAITILIIIGVIIAYYFLMYKPEHRKLFSGISKPLKYTPPSAAGKGDAKLTITLNKTATFPVTPSSGALNYYQVYLTDSERYTPSGLIPSGDRAKYKFLANVASATGRTVPTTVACVTASGGSNTCDGSETAITVTGNGVPAKTNFYVWLMQTDSANATAIGSWMYAGSFISSV
jgi:hypothetical protein